MLAAATAAALGRPEMTFTGFPALAFALAALGLGRRGPASRRAD